MKKILVIGASGMLGKPVTEELLHAGYRVSLLARDPGKLWQLFPGVKTLEGDVFDLASLHTAFHGFDTVYINLSVNRHSGQTDPQPEREGIDNIISAAKSTGVLRLVYLSSLIMRYQGMNGFYWWAFDMKLSAVKKIKQSGIAYSIFYPSSFMETFTQLVRGRNLMLATGSRQGMWFIAAHDFGKQVANAMKIAGPGNQEYSIQGLEAFTWDGAARVFIRNHKGPLKIMKAPIGILKFLGRFSNNVNYGANILTALNNYPERFESEKTWKELGKPTITLAEYAAGF